MEDKLVQMPLVLTCALLLMALTARSMSSGKIWEGRRAGISLKEELPICLFWPANFSFCGAQRVQPKMVMEYWTGWFDSWGGPHNILDSSGECFAIPKSSMCIDL